MRSWSLYIGRYAGVDFRVHITFLFLLLFFLLGEIGRSGPGVIVRCCFLTALVLISQVLHELGHAIVSLRKGFPIRGIILLPVTGITIGDPSVREESARNFRRETLISLAGPLVNLLLAGAAAAVFLSLGMAARLWKLPLLNVADLGTSFFWINVFLFGLNLLS